MRRREFIAGLGSAAAWPLAVRAQQAGVPLIGFVDGGTADAFADRMRASATASAKSGTSRARTWGSSTTGWMADMTSCQHSWLI
jgi:putative ABC transport system substrate-binding protein